MATLFDSLAGSGAGNVSIRHGWSAMCFKSVAGRKSFAPRGLTTTASTISHGTSDRFRIDMCTGYQRSARVPMSADAMGCSALTCRR